MNSGLIMSSVRKPSRRRTKTHRATRQPFLVNDAVGHKPADAIFRLHRDPRLALFCHRRSEDPHIFLQRGIEMSEAIDLDAGHLLAQPGMRARMRDYRGFGKTRFPSGDANVVKMIRRKKKTRRAPAGKLFEVRLAQG